MDVRRKWGGEGDTCEQGGTGGGQGPADASAQYTSAIAANPGKLMGH